MANDNSKTGTPNMKVVRDEKQNPDNTATRSEAELQYQKELTELREKMKKVNKLLDKATEERVKETKKDIIEKVTNDLKEIKEAGYFRCPKMLSQQHINEPYNPFIYGKVKSAFIEIRDGMVTASVKLEDVFVVDKNRVEGGTQFVIQLVDNTQNNELMFNENTFEYMYACSEEEYEDVASLVKEVGESIEEMMEDYRFEDIYAAHQSSDKGEKPQESNNKQ